MKREGLLFIIVVLIITLNITKKGAFIYMNAPGLVGLVEFIIMKKKLHYICMM